MIRAIGISNMFSYFYFFFSLLLIALDNCALLTSKATSHQPQQSNPEAGELKNKLCGQQNE